MAWQQISTQKTLLSSAMTFMLIGSAGISHAMTVSSTQINSAQYEPLNAVIEIKDINPDDFSAKIADSRVFEQMGLENSNHLNVNFVRTSDSSGKLVITSARPVQTPYQNIVLDLSERGQNTFLPKTLLVATNDVKQLNIKQAKTQVDIQADMSDVSTHHNQYNNQYDDYQVTNASQVNLPISHVPADSNFDGNMVLDDNVVLNDNVVFDDNIVASSDSALNTGTAKHTLKDDASLLASNTTSNTTLASNRTHSFTTLDEPPIGELASDHILLNALGVDTTDMTGTATDTVMAQSQPQPTASSTDSLVDANDPETHHRKTYVVQRNDNLWMISNNIAKRNNVSVYQVMKQIQQDNPDAFIDGKASRIIANAQIILPDYEFIPSQNSLEKALAAKREQLANEQTASGGKKSSTTPSTTKKRYQAKNTAKAANRVALVAPSITNQSANSSNNAPSTDLVGRLKNTRQSTASTVRSVNGLNHKFSDYAKKLEVQNEKIAQLEAKLKELKQ